MSDLGPDSMPEVSRPDEGYAGGGDAAFAQNYFEVEVSDLAPEDGSQAAPPTHLAMSARRSQAARARRVILVSAALLALVGIFGSNTALRGQAISLLVGTPAPTLPPTATLPTSPTPIPGPEEWLFLEERSLFLPMVMPGSHCPVSRGRQVNRDLGPAVGDGPAYAAYGGGSAVDGVLEYSDARFLGSGGTSDWGFQEVVWAVRPDYNGPVLIRGRQIDGPNLVLFNGGIDQEHYIGSWAAAPMLTELRLLGSTDNLTWTYWGTYTRVLAPGCYAYQIDGLGFSDIVVFQAVMAPGR